MPITTTVYTYLGQRYQAPSVRAAARNMVSEACQLRPALVRDAIPHFTWLGASPIFPRATGRRKIDSATRIISGVWLDTKQFQKANIENRLRSLFNHIGLPDHSPKFSRFRTQGVPGRPGYH